MVILKAFPAQPGGGAGAGWGFLGHTMRILPLLSLLALCAVAGGWPLEQRPLEYPVKIITPMLAVVCAALLWDYTFVWWMGDGLEGLGGERRAVAEEFIEWAPKFCDAPAAARAKEIALSQKERWDTTAAGGVEFQSG